MLQGKHCRVNVAELMLQSKCCIVNVAEEHVAGVKHIFDLIGP